MVRLKSVHLITNEGFSFYNQIFETSEQDQNMLSSLIKAIDPHSPSYPLTRSLSEVDLSDADLIIEQGEYVIAGTVVVFDRENKERDEHRLRTKFFEFIKKFEEIYSKELDAFFPIFQKSLFSGVETLFKDHFTDYLLERRKKWNDRSEFTSLLS